MLTKAIKYVDFNGNEKTKNFYFHLSKTEIAEMDLVERAGLEGIIKQMINTDDRAAILNMFKGIVLKSYGVPSADGERFEKSEELRHAFEQHPAYDILFMELISSEKAMADFINSIVPSDVAENAKNNKKTINDLMGYEVIPEKKDTEPANVVPMDPNKK